MPEDFTSGSVAVEDAPDFSKDAVEAKPDFSGQAIQSSDKPSGNYDYLPPLPTITAAQLAEDKTLLLQRPALTFHADEESFGGIPMIPAIGKEGSKLRTATEFAGGIQESVLGAAESMTTRESMLTLPVFAIPVVGPALGLGLGAKIIGAGAGELVAGIEAGEPRAAGRGAGNVGVGSFMVGGGAKGARSEITSVVPEPVAEALAPRTTEALKSFLPAKVQEGERAGISTEPPTDIETYATLKERFQQLTAAGDLDSPEFQATFKAIEDLKNKHGGAVPGTSLAPEPAAQSTEPIYEQPSTEPQRTAVETPKPKDGDVSQTLGIVPEATPENYGFVPAVKLPSGKILTGPADAVNPHQEIESANNVTGQRVRGWLKDGVFYDTFVAAAREIQRLKEAKPEPVAPAEAPKPKEPWQMSRSEFGDTARSKVDQTPGLPEAPPHLYVSLLALENKLNRKPYNPDLVIESQLAALRDAGLISKSVARPRFTEEGRSKLTDWKRSAKERDMAVGDISDKLVDESMDEHKASVEKAMREGKPVPPEVLADYPDLAKAAFKEPTAPTTTTQAGDKPKAQSANQEINTLILQHGIEKKWTHDLDSLHGPWITETSGLGSMGIAAKLRQTKDLKTARNRMVSDLGLPKDKLQTPEGRSEILAALKQRLAPKAPKLRPGEQGTGELLQGKDVPFNLAGEKGVDAERIAAEKAAKEKAEREKSDLEEKQQRDLFEEDPREGDPFWASRTAKESFADIFGMAEGDLRDLLESKTEPSKPTGEALEARRPGTFDFPSYDEFRNWMDARYAELDHEGMRLAFAEAPTANKIAYIKENRGADSHKKAWLTNLATGSILPTERPPLPRTTPRPMPGVVMPTGGVPPAYPQPPPPPPRAPSLHPNFDLTALVQLYRQFGKFPVMNDRLKSAYGRFIPSKELVELKSRLMWDTKLAERVLGHEIGHFIDLIVPLIGKGKQFGQRLRLLTDFTGQVWKAKELRADAKSLSRQWRGSFADGDKYRDTAKELIADFMSAMLHDPEWVNQNYPRLYDSFSEFRTAKPGFSTVYREIETWLQGGTIPRELFEQDRAAVKRTFDILSQKPDVSRASIGDKISQSMITLWNRAFQKEGAVRRIGESISEKLETSYMWAAKRMALWSDDYTRTVQPHIDKIADDPVEAHTALLSYSKSVRTIGERRAAGVWIEQHPTESFDMIQHLLNLDSALKSKFQTQLDAIGQGGNLYDFAAQVFREIHDRGERFVNRMGREIDSLDLGVDGEAALIAFNVRGKLLNPGGLTEANANRVITDLRNRLTPDQFTALETAAKNLRGLMFDVQKEMFDAGLISKKTWDNLIAPNTDNYLPYAVLDYFDGRVKAGIMPQKGTAKDIADVGVATQLKVASSYTWLQKQRQVQLLRDIESQIAHGPIPVGDALRNARDIDVVRTKGKNATDDVSRAVYWVDGKPHVVEFPNDAGKLLQHALELPDFYQHLEWLHATSRFTHQVMQVFTTLSPRFLLYRNIIRGFRTAGLKVGYFRAAEQMGPENFKRNIRFAKNYADAAFGAEMLPEVRRMVDLEALPPPHIAAGAVRDLPHMRELLERGALPVFSAKKLSEFAPERQTKLARGWQTVKEPLQKVFTTYEAFEKIYNYQAALEKGLPEETAAAIAARGGIPRPGVSGKWSSAAEVIWPWTRVRTQGIRASVQMVRDPRFGKAFAARFAVFEGLPRIAKVAIGLGLANKAISWVMRKDEDKDDPVLGEVARRVSPYKMALDDVVPFVFYDTRTGKYHPFWEFKAGKDVPAHFEVVSIRIPASEEGQTFGNALYQTLVSIPGIREQLGRPGQGPIEALTAATENIGPQLSPVISTTATLKEMILSGRNPPDPWSGSPSANPRLFDAGGTDRAQAIAGYMMNKSGGPGEVAAILAANVGLLDERARQALSYRLQTDKQPLYEKFPFLATAVSHDNYAQYRDEKTAILAEDQLRARARLVMPPEVAVMYDFYYRNLQRKGKLDAYDSARFGIASEFVNSVWGRLADQDSFYGRAAHAVSKDGSKQAKETLKRDLLSATEGLRISWQEVK